MQRNRKQREQGLSDVPKTKTKTQVVADVLDVTVASLSNMPSIEMSGNRQAMIDGVEGVLEYDASVIRLKLRKMTIKFTGRGLFMKSLSNENAVVEGFIATIEFGV